MAGRSRGRRPRWDARGRRRVSWLASWLAFTAILFNTLALLVLPTQPAAAMPGGPGGMVICTVGGVVVIGADGTVQRDVTGGQVCVNCLPLVEQGLCQLPGVGIVAIATGVGAGPVLPAVETIPCRRMASIPLARAPPAA